MRNLLPLAPFVAVIPLGEALATHSYAAVPLAALLFAGLVAMVPDRAMPSARALVLRTEPASSLGYSASVAIAGDER